MPETSSSLTTQTEGSRTVVALMIFTVVFSLIGNEVKVANGTAAKGSGGELTTAGRIIVGGFVATAALALLTHAGEGGRQFGVGLALVTMATATLVYGGPVWDTISNLEGSKPTAPLAATAATTPTTPGSSTAGSAVTIATNLA